MRKICFVLLLFFIILAFQALAEEKPDLNNLSSNMLSKIYASRGDYDKAIEYANKVLAIDPNDLQSNTLLGQLYTYIGDYDKAIEYANKILAIDSNNYTSKQILEVSCFLKGKYTEEQMQSILESNKYEVSSTPSSINIGISSETITVDEILLKAEQYLKPYAKKADREIFESHALPVIRAIIKGKATDILLYDEAYMSAPMNIDESIEKAVESEVARFVASYGNNYDLAEQAIEQMGMNWKSFREYQKKLILTQSYLSSIIKEEKQYSHSDLLDYYESVKDELFTEVGFVSFSIIDIIPDKLTAEQIAEGETSQTAAKRIAGELVEAIENGADFADLAKQYHGDLASVGGKILPIEPDTNAFPEPYNSLEATAVQMQPGQIKGPIEIDGHVFLIHLDDLQKGEVKSFSEVQKLIEQQIQYQHRQKRYEELLRKLFFKADVTQLEQFSRLCSEAAYDRWGGS